LAGGEHEVSILIKGCSVLDETRDDGYSTGLNILIEGNRVSKITSDDIPEQGVHKVIGGSHLLAIPGLINAHTHSPENFPKGTKERVPLELWLQDLFLLGDFSAREIYLSTMLGAIEMLKTGTTATLDHFWMGAGLTTEGLDAAMQAYADSGMRVGLAPLVEDSDRVLRAAVLVRPKLGALTRRMSKPMEARAYIELLEGFFNKWHQAESGRLRCLAGPSGPQRATDELLQGSLEVVRRHNGGWHTHVAESKVQAMVCFEIYGKSAVAAMNERGLLGPDVSLAHCVWLDQADLEILARTRTRVCHNPVCNLRIGSGVAPVIEMLERGIKVSIGTDGSASNDNQVMFDAMKTAGLIHTLRTRDHHRWPSSRDILHMATANGAAALGMGTELGELKPGRIADLTLLDMSTMFFTPINDAFLHLVYAENGSSVRTVIVDGRVVLEDGRILTVGEKNIMLEAREAWAKRRQELPRARKEAESMVREFELYQQEMVGREFHLDRF
jgi:5-methylthioadenosine/S-adenosylhomocysteine deaminase